MRDPFDTESIRAATVSAWTSSPTRLKEDAATEDDLVRGGYRDRLLTELAQNAADAASRAGVLGAMRVWSSGSAVHVANTGAPLDIGGVHALTALRVSAKTDGVGRFGVGFTAVRAVSDDIEFRSAAGGVAFSSEATQRALADAGLSAPGVGVPVLRLVWPSSEPPAVGFASEIVLRLRDDDVDAVLDSMRSEAVDLLLELESLESIEVAGDVIHRDVENLDGRLDLVTIGDLRWWQYRTEHARWLIPLVDGVPRRASSDVLRAPTRSDEELSLPVLLVADVAMQPDRRRVLPGADVRRVADGYGDVLAALPGRYRPSFVPVPGFARSAVDGVLREQMLHESTTTAWLLGCSGDNLVPSRATVLPGLTDELGDALVDVFPGLVSASLSGPRDATALAAVGVHRLGLAELAEVLTGVDREPSWWGTFYDALSPLVVDGIAAEELAALPVPLTDGRTVTGPRTTVLGEGISAAGAVPWARLVHPDAARSLLSRLGAAEATASDLLADPAVEALLDDLDWDDAESVETLTESILSLAADARALPSWLGSLPLTDSEGELRAADELLLPDAPLADVLSEQSPFGLVATEIVDRFGAEALRAIGVGWGFGVVTDELPTAPDHELDDEESWWESLPEEPDVLLAVRDLDLVDESRWPQALTQLVTDPSTSAALQDRFGYTAWWLRTHAHIDGARLESFRAPSEDTFDGLLDPFDHPHADALAYALASNRCESAWFARLIVERLADPLRSPTPAVIARAHRLLADAVLAGRVDLDDLDLPPRIRAISGALVDPDVALVLDRPWLVSVVPAEVAVLSSMETASVLASILDVRTASEAVDAEVMGVGRVSSWDREPRAVLACAALGLELPVGQVVVHRDLVVRLTGAVTGERDVPWWVTPDGITHLADGAERSSGR
ncbi:MAG: ATP-binding protein [Rhodococcus sp. (in: high G+C Gram-positive bacteria)]